MIPLRLLRTRVARRILGLFLVCAIVPVGIFAVLAYRVASTRLQAEATNSLRGGSKIAGLILMDHLLGLVKELGSTEAPLSFETVAFESADGRMTALRGTLGRVPELSPTQRSRISLGGPVLLTGAVSRSARVFLIVPSPRSRDGFPRRWGVLAPSAILGLDSVTNPVPDGAELCLVASPGQPLDCPSSAVVAVGRQTANRGAEVTWQRGDSTFLMGTWDLFLGREFAAPPWSIGLSIPRSVALQPIADFRRTFLLSVALAGFLVFLLSHAQLRKRMTPLAELEAGVRRLRSGDFATPVVVRSNDEFESLAGSFNGMAMDLRRQLTTLTALRSIDMAALEVRSARAVAEAALKWAPELLGGDRVAIAYANAEDPGHWTVTSAGASRDDSRSGLVRPTGAELAELQTNPEHLLLEAGTAGRSYCNGYHVPEQMTRMVFPLRHNGRIRATLVVGRRRGSTFSITTIESGRHLAAQLAVAISNVSMLGELDALGLGAMLALARTIDAASPWTGGHSERVTHTAMEIGRRVGFEQADLERLRRGGLLHDIGKIAVPPQILNKAGPLTAEEQSVIQAHPRIGADIVKPIAAFHELVPLVLYHHELLDGSGYPEGLAGEAIPPLVRVLTVADIFDALTSDRPYRRGLSCEAALTILRAGAGSKYEANAVRALEEALRAGWTAPLIASPPLPAEAVESQPNIRIEGPTPQEAVA